MYTKKLTLASIQPRSDIVPRRHCRARGKSHGSYLIHGAIYKSTRDILAVGDI